MAPVLTARRLPILVAFGIVAFAFWPALFGGGSLVSADIVATAPPFDSYRPEGFSLENGPGDPINIHAHWASLAADVRAGDAGWWNTDLAGGQPTMKGGLPVFDLPYLVTPGWFAPGAVAALRVLVAIGLSVGFLRAVGLARVAALAGGLAFGFSGFMVGWMNWPHSSVAALAPGLLWAAERLIRDPRPWRAVPLGLVVALMVWSNYPSVLIYLLLGVAVYVLVRSFAEWRGRQGRGWFPIRIAVGALAMAIAVLLAAPHLIGFAEYVDWADTSHRVGSQSDSSAGVKHLLTAVAPAVWGSDAVGEPWFGAGNWVEYQAHAGASVVVLAVFGLVAAVRDPDRRRRSVAVGLIGITGLGVLIAYVGGPVGEGLGNIAGSQGGLMTRAKVLWSLGIAFGAALGVERLVGIGSEESRRRLRGDLLMSVAVFGGALVLLAPSILDWLDIVRRDGIFRETVSASTVSILAMVATWAVVGAAVTRRISGQAVGWVLVGIVGFELLSFAMPVPTIVGRSERLNATPAHEVAVDLLATGERLAGEGRTFFPSTTQLFGIDDARGQVLKSPGYQSLLRAVDPQMLELSGGGTPTYPNIGIGTDPTSEVWDALGVGLWAQFPDSIPHGTRRGPAPGVDEADPAVGALRGDTTVPEGGLRGVLFRIEPRVGGVIDVAVTTEEGRTAEQRWVEPVDAGVVGVAVVGEHLAVGSAVSVEVTAPASTTFVNVDAEGRVPVGTVAGDDELELVRVGDVILLDRPVEPVRLVDAVAVSADPVTAAAEVARRASDATAVVDREVGLPRTSDPAAELDILVVDYATDRITARVESDRDALLVVSQVYYPGWEATVDGVGAEVVVADAAFVGVRVGPGSHEVRLTFRPRHLGLGVLSILVGLGVVVGIVIDAGRRGDLRLFRRSAG